MRPSAYVIDDRRFPLVTARSSPHVHEEAALDETYRQLEGLLTRQQPMLVLFDLRNSVSSPGRRKRFAEWSARHEAAIARYVLAMAVVVGNQLERGVVTAVVWMKAPAVAMRVFTEESEAEAWLREQLR